MTMAYQLLLSVSRKLEQFCQLYTRDDWWNKMECVVRGDISVDNAKVLAKTLEEQKDFFIGLKLLQPQGPEVMKIIIDALPNFGNLELVWYAQMRVASKLLLVNYRILRFRD